MKLFDTLVDVIFLNAVFTACCAVAMFVGTEVALVPGYCFQLGWIHLYVGASTLFVYNFPYAISGMGLPIFQHGGNKMSHSVTIGCSGIAASAMILAFPHIRLSILLLSVGCGVVALSYSLPLLPFQHFRQLRNHGIVKIVTLASVWAIVTVIFPVVHHHLSIPTTGGLLIQRLTLLFAISLLFDSRDTEEDALETIQTIPILAGALKTRILITSLAIIYWAEVSLFPTVLQANTDAISKAIVPLYMIIATTQLRPRTDKRLFILIADGSMLVYCLSTCVGRPF